MRYVLQASDKLGFLLWEHEIPEGVAFSYPVPEDEFARPLPASEDIVEGLAHLIPPDIKRDEITWTLYRYDEDAEMHNIVTMFEIASASRDAILEDPRAWWSHQGNSMRFWRCSQSLQDLGYRISLPALRKRCTSPDVIDNGLPAVRALLAMPAFADIQDKLQICDP